MHHPTDKIAHTTAFVTPVVEHWLEREIEKYKRFVVIYSDEDRSELKETQRCKIYVTAS